MGLLGKNKKKKDTVAAAENVEGTAQDQEGVTENQGSGGGLGSLVSKVASGKTRTKLRDNERLASVVDETEPGWAVSTLEENPNFVLPGGLGYVVLGLQTQSREFGGLSTSTNKDEAKGMIANLINTGSINAVVTPDLLDADILGLVLDEHSYKDIDDYGILRKARYVYTVITVHPNTGALVSFWVPATDEKSMTSGLLYDEAVEVFKGQTSISEVIDLDLVEMMVRVLTSEHGMNGLDDAMGANQEVINTYVVDGKVPDPDVLVSNLAAQFPDVFTEEATGAAGPTEQVGDGVETAVPEVEDTGAVEDTADEPEFTEDGDAEPPAEPTATGRHHAVDDDEEPDFGSDEPDFSEGDANDDEEPLDDEDDDGVTEAESTGRHAAKSQIDDLAGRGVVNTAEMSEESLTSLADMLSERMAARMGELPATGSDGETGDQVIQEMSGPDDRVFTTKDVNDAALRVYLNDDLGLVIDETALQTNLRYEVPQLTLPEDIPVTEWLRDQLEALVSGFNDELLTVWQNDMVTTRREFSEMMDSEFAAIREDMDPENRNGRFAEVVRLIHQDAEETRAELPKYVAAAQEQVIEHWKEDKKRWMERETADLDARYEHKFGPRRANELQRAHDNVASMQEETVETEWAQLHTKRRNEAGVRAATSESVVLESMKPLVEVRRERLDQLRESFSNQIREYINEHREEDLHQANVNAQALERDTRIQTILADARSEVEAANQRAETEIERTQQARERDRASFQEELERARSNAAALSSSAETDIAAANSRVDAAVADAERRVVEAETRADEMVAKAQASSDLDAASARNFVQNHKNNNTLMIFFIIMAVVVAVIASSFVTVWVTG